MLAPAGIRLASARLVGAASALPGLGLALFGPLVLWLASFSAVYGVQGMSCAKAWGNTPVLIAWFVAIALQAALLSVLYSKRYGARSGTERWASLTLGVIGLIAVIWTLFPTAILPGCAATDRVVQAAQVDPACRQRNENRERTPQNIR